MDYYLLGDGCGRNPPYLYREFKKEVWRSISPSAIRYARPEGKNIDFWGLACVTGRRDRKGGLERTRALGKQIPFKPAVAQNLIGDGDNWAVDPRSPIAVGNDSAFSVSGYPPV
jgi:hypothetical protein